MIRKKNEGEGQTLQEREQKWKGSWRTLSQVRQFLPDPLQALDCGLGFKNTTFALFIVYGCAPFPFTCFIYKQLTTIQFTNQKFKWYLNLQSKNNINPKIILPGHMSNQPTYQYPPIWPHHGTHIF